MALPTSYQPPKWLQAEAAHLQGDVGQAAVNGQILTYPQVVRTMMDTPIPGQSHCAVSYMLFDTPKKSPNGKPIYGFVKVRGCSMDEASAKTAAAKIVKEQDSKFRIGIAQVGAWIPVTEDESFIKEAIDVKAAEGQPQLRDEGVKKKEADAREKMRQIRDREEELQRDGDIYDDKTSLKYYTMKRVTEMKVVEMLETLQKRLADLKEKVVLVRNEICDLEDKYPPYATEWVDCYNAERAKTNIPAYIPAGDQFADLDAHRRARACGGLSNP